MAQETEKKFLVRNGDFRKEAFKSLRIIQGYLSSVPERTVRIRIRDDRGFITIKGLSNASGASRYEWEKEITAGEALELLQLAEPGIIDKTRYLIGNADGRHMWEVDEFHGMNEGLTVAEIELGEEDEPFDRPEWLGDEVTGNPKYFNSELMKNPFTNWE